MAGTVPIRTRILLPLIVFMGLAIAVILVVPSATATQQTVADDIVYAEALDDDWQNWSWGTSIDFNQSAIVHDGTSAFSATHTSGWAGLFLYRKDDLVRSHYDTLHFWIHGGSNGGQAINVFVVDSDDDWGTPLFIQPSANSWIEFNIPITDFTNSAFISGVVFQQANGSPSGNDFIVDDLRFVGGTPPTLSAPALHVNIFDPQHTINPHIYGMNFADETFATEIDLSLNRWGGNATTRYNWQLDVSNRANDWFFENIANNGAVIENLPDGSNADLYVEQNNRTNTDVIMTMPLIGWTPKSRDFSCAFPVAQYGAQAQTDPYNSACGNGMTPAGDKITGNDPLLTSTAIGTSFATDWIAHLIGRYGTAANGGVKFYSLDNEPMLWNSTHRDVHPDPVGYDEIRDLTYSYGAAIKAADPTAQVLGPALWGWTAYEYSAIDAESGNWSNPPDRNAHGGTPLVEWYLQQMAAYETDNGQRILDYLDIHYYPQSNGVALQGAGRISTQARRLEPTRSLWDATYTDDSWINTEIQLISRMRGWVDKNYPGTKLALTEYNFGGMESMNGALTQVDVLGIFGRENLDMATLWAGPGSNDPGAQAFLLFSNYDGNGHTFGNISLPASSDDQSYISIYAARDAGSSDVTILVINKTDQTMSTTLSFEAATLPDGVKDASLVSGLNDVAEVYRYSEANLNAIVQLADSNVVDGELDMSLPAHSITMYRLPGEVTAVNIVSAEIISPTLTFTLLAIAALTTTTAFMLYHRRTAITTR